MEAWVHAQVNTCGICGKQSGTETGFLQVTVFCQYHSNVADHTHILVSGG
jgi:hypothetical protein